MRPEIQQELDEILIELTSESLELLKDAYLNIGLFEFATYVCNFQLHLHEINLLLKN